MIAIIESQFPSSTVSVNPSDRIFDELGRNTYDYRDLLSELIDNSIAARRHGVDLKITIQIYIDSSGKSQRFVIKDNASGIPIDKLGDAVSPAAIKTSSSLNEHGLGLKQAVSAIGKLDYLATKCIDEPHGKLIKEFRYGDIEILGCEMDVEAGTEISIINVKPIVSSAAQVYTRSIKEYLGARYRRYLKPGARSLYLRIELRSYETPETVNYEWIIDEVKPVYFHPSTRRNEPVILRHKLEGTGWAAELTFGYAPSLKEEYEELGLDQPNKFHPYRNSLSTQGLDILFHDRVILFHQLSELNLVPNKHNDFNSVRGEIDLKYGFSTAITKNSMILDEHMLQLIEKVKGILIGDDAGPGGQKKDYLKRISYPEDLPERLLRDRLVEWLKNNPLQSKESVEVEYAVEGIDGYIDILADNEAWELKTSQTKAYDVFQLFMYMDVAKIVNGFLLAQDHSPGSIFAAKHILQNHGKNIRLVAYKDFPITQPASEQDRKDYY